MIEKIKETGNYIRSVANGPIPTTAIILGTGLGALVDHIENKQYIPYSSIPNFPVSTVEGHSGNLIFGTLGNRPVMAMQGRFHFYEGYDMKTVTFPVRVMKELGIKTLFVSNAAGGMNPEFRVGDLMVGDAVGMSTVPEVIVARHAGMEVFGVSVITDLGVEGVVEKVSHEDVQKAANAAQPKMMEIMTELVKRYEE